MNAATIDVWLARLDLPAAQVSRLSSLLSEDEKARARGFVAAEGYNQFIAARAFLRTLLGQLLARDPASLRFRYGAFGKPALDLHGAEFDFNLSHAGAVAAVAVAERAALWTRSGRWVDGQQLRSWRRVRRRGGLLGGRLGGPVACVVLAARHEHNQRFAIGAGRSPGGLSVGRQRRWSAPRRTNFVNAGGVGVVAQGRNTRAAAYVLSSCRGHGSAFNDAGSRTPLKKALNS
jgi:hypothetical protein